MGLKDFFFGGGGSSRGKTRVDKLTKRVINQYAQSVDRYSAMEDLLKLAAETWEKALKLPDDSPERAELERTIDDAYVGVLRRFTMVASKTIDDEEEKGWLYRRLTAIGKPMLGPIKRFAVEAEGIAWPLRIVEDVANETEEWEIIDALLEAHPPAYERDSSPKLQMLTHLKEIDDPRVREILIRYLADPDENVRFFCIEALIQNAEVEARDALTRHLDADHEDSVRLRTRILDGLADLGWDLSEYAEIVRKHLDDEHSFDGTKLHRR
ncbi:MAG: HEAT repeat domain-containing protein [Myxococcales bacterium]|nr:HEAT repeat domain-containing protein [Myxococcales bacterium]